MKRNELLEAHGTNYYEMTMELLNAARVNEMIPDKSSRIGIKPNLLGQSPPEIGATTHPILVEAVIDYLREWGFENLVVLEGSWVGDTTSLALKCCGYDKMLARKNVPFWDMQKDDSFVKDCAGMDISICSKVSDIDFLINMPVVKGHCQTRVTCAVKNLKGLIPNSEKRRFHRMGLHDPIGHLGAGIKQDLIIMDSICGDLTFEDGGDPVERNCIILALDPLLADSYACDVVGVRPDQVGYLKVAERLGVGQLGLENAKITRIEHNESVKASAGSGESTRGGRGYGYVMKLRESTCEIDSCSACYAYLIPALDMLEREGLLDQLKEKVCIGQGHRGKSGVLGVGNCTARFEHNLKGCPPTEGQMYEFLKQYIVNS